MNIVLHIERLVLDGIPIDYSGRHALQTAVAAELGRLLADGGLLPAQPSGGPQASGKAKGIQLRSTELTGSRENPTQLGQQIAQAVYRGIGR